MSDKRASTNRRAKRTPQKLADPDKKLRARLKTAEETLAAIQSGEVDALMVAGRRGKQVVTLQGGEHAYRLLVEAMGEGAATLASDGVVLYANRKFAELIRIPIGKVGGISVASLLEQPERARFKALLTAARAYFRSPMSLSRT